MVWETEIEHGKFFKCQCGQLCKKINIKKKVMLPVHKFVCINQNNKLHPGCKVFKDGWLKYEFKCQNHIIGHLTCILLILRT